MRLIQELRKRARYVVGPVLGTCAVGYFAYHAVHGERGLIAYGALTQRIEEAEALLERSRNARRALAHRVSLLHPESLDPDMLDERARAMLNYGYPEDIVILLDETRSPERSSR
jgi:cell division protein FtsB